MRFLNRTALVAGVLCAVIVAAETGSSSAAASARSAFCGPRRALQSFGGGPAQGFAAHLAVAQGVIRPGTYTTLRVVDEGSDELEEVGERIQRWTGSSWIRMPEAGGPTIGAIAFVHPRSVSGCIGSLTGTHRRPGKYRYILEVEAIEK